MALNLIGESKYAADRPGYEACDVFFKNLYTELLSKHDWSFARRIRELPPIVPEELRKVDENGDLVKEPDSSSPVCWRLPVDCLRVVEMRGIKNWRIYGRDVYCEGEKPPTGASIECIYTSSSLSDDGQLPEIARGFVSILVYRLAACLAAAVKNDQSLSLQFVQLAQDAFQSAIVLDTQQDNSNDQHPLQEILSRNIFNSNLQDNQLWGI